MKYDFDRTIKRKGTHCEKWDELDSHFGMTGEGNLALWVADMEFAPPREVGQSLRDMLDKEIFGYFGDYTDYNNAVCQWMDKRHGWKVDPDWILCSHGIVMGVNTIVQAYLRPGDKVILNTPVYYPFFMAIENNGCHVLANKLVKESGKYVIDFDDLETKMAGGAKMMILCSPHNPGGRVWTKDELTKIAELCLKHDVMLVSDEIHQDLVFSPNRHTVMASLDNEVADKVITCTSATKTFNMAGTMTGNVIIKNQKLREQLWAQMSRIGMFQPNGFGPVAATAAYTHGQDWLDQLLDYLKINRDLIRERIKKMQGVEAMELEGTYLAWLDFAKMPMSMDEIVSRVQDKAKLALNHGPDFGPGGEKHLRLNFACPKAMIIEALDRLEAAF